jgi:hypothetical protein
MPRLKHLDMTTNAAVMREPAPGDSPDSAGFAGQSGDAAGLNGTGAGQTRYEEGEPPHDQTVQMSTLDSETLSALDSQETDMHKNA